MSDHIDELIEKVGDQFPGEWEWTSDMLRAVAEAALALGTETVEKRRDRIRREFAREALEKFDESAGGSPQDWAFRDWLREQAGEND